jgi:hypothetical protein
MYASSDVQRNSKLNWLLGLKIINFTIPNLCSQKFIFSYKYNNTDPYRDDKFTVDFKNAQKCRVVQSREKWRTAGRSGALRREKWRTPVISATGRQGLGMALNS